MNSITDLLDLEDGDLCITETQIQGQTKTITIETKPVAHYCPNCGYRMYSRGVKKRKVNHPILQDNYSLIIILKQRRWRCTNPECLYDISENFKFVNKRRRTSNATDMLIVDAYRNLMETSVSIAKKFHVSDSHAHEVFDRYVKLDRLPLTDAISIDEVCIDMDERCKYALVIQDFNTGDPIDLLRSRRNDVTEPYFTGIPIEERLSVRYLISDMYKPYIAYVETKDSPAIFYINGEWRYEYPTDSPAVMRKSNNINYIITNDGIPNNDIPIQYYVVSQNTGIKDNFWTSSDPRSLKSHSAGHNGY